MITTPSRAVGRRVRFHPLEISGIERLCDDAVAITFAVPDALTEEFAFRPGQSLTVRRLVDGRDERRSYSICSPAGAAPRIGVREVSGGVISGWLAREVGVGDRVEVQPPAGSFVPDLEHAGRHVFLAAGSGITPVLSIAASLLQRRDNKVTILYGNRRTSSVMFADELADLKDAHFTRLQLLHVLSREPQEVELFNGRLDAGKLRALLPATCDLGRVDHWWLCGPFGMVTDAVEVLIDLDVTAERIHRELFYVEELPPEQDHHPEESPVGDSEVIVVLDGRSTTVQVDPGTLILDAAQRVRADVPFACRGGVCGTCRARVVSGEVRMRSNFALEPDEVAAGFVLTCQALPVSDHVVVNFDA